MLCKGVTSIAPGECFREIGSYPDNKSVERAYELCKVNESRAFHYRSELTQSN